MALYRLRSREVETQALRLYYDLRPPASDLRSDSYRNLTSDIRHPTSKTKSNENSKCLKTTNLKA